MLAYMHIEYSTYQFSEKSVVLRGLNKYDQAFFWLRKYYIMIVLKSITFYPLLIGLVSVHEHDQLRQQY